MLCCSIFSCVIGASVLYSYLKYLRFVLLGKNKQLSFCLSVAMDIHAIFRSGSSHGQANKMARYAASELIDTLSEDDFVNVGYVRRSPTPVPVITA